MFAKKCQLSQCTDTCSYGTYPHGIIVTLLVGEDLHVYPAAPEISPHSLEHGIHDNG